MKQLSEVSYMRCFAVVMIVLWHCYFCPVICWPVIDKSLIHPCYAKAMLALGQFAFPDCMMPIFTFLSGYLFYYLFTYKNKYGEFKAFFINKLNRLLIPFFILGSIISLTSPDRHIEQVYWGEGSALWYSAMLFWCFLIAWLPLVKGFKYLNYILAVLSLSFCLYSVSVWTTPFELPLGIDNAFFYLHYFILGEYACKHRDKIFETITQKHLVLLLLVYLVSCGLVFIKTPIITHLRIVMQSYLFLLITLRIALNYTSRDIPVGGDCPKT